MIKNKFIKKKIKGIEIDVRSKKSLYIKMDGWTVYIDNSTNEHIIDHWYDDTPTVHNRDLLSKPKKTVIADRYMTLESVKPNKDCKVCDHVNDYVCFDHEHEQIKKVYPNCKYTDDCEWVINETVPHNDIREANNDR